MIWLPILSITPFGAALIPDSPVPCPALGPLANTRHVGYRRGTTDVRRHPMLRGPAKCVIRNGRGAIPAVGRVPDS